MLATARSGIEPLRERPFRLLWIGQATSAVGDAMTPVAVIFAVLETTGSAGDLGIVLAAFTLAHAVFILVGGVWGDRLQRRRRRGHADGAHVLLRRAHTGLDRRTDPSELTSGATTNFPRGYSPSRDPHTRSSGPNGVPPRPELASSTHGRIRSAGRSLVRPGKENDGNDRLRR